MAHVLKQISFTPNDLDDSDGAEEQKFDASSRDQIDIAYGEGCVLKMLQCLDENQNDCAADLEQVLSQTVSAMDQNKVSLPNIERLLLQAFRRNKSVKKLKDAKRKRMFYFLRGGQFKLSNEQNDLFMNRLGGIFRRVYKENIDVKLKLISGLTCFNSIVEAISGDKKGQSVSELAHASASIIFASILL